jgi:hypothetical protein
VEQFPGFPAPDFAPPMEPYNGDSWEDFGAGPMPEMPEPPEFSPMALALLEGAQQSPPPPDPVLMHYRPSQPMPDERALRDFQDALAAFGQP